ncbi:hypothetical protein SprV_0401708000 [Sparganum proliferum]
MVNFYRRFLPHSADTILPLTSLLSGSKGPYEMSAEALAAFDKVKAALADATLLTHFSPDTPISLMVDASNVAVGAVLQQHLTGHTQPLPFSSRKLSPAVGSPCDEDISGIQIQDPPLTTDNVIILCDVSTTSHRPFCRHPSTAGSSPPCKTYRILGVELPTS